MRVTFDDNMTIHGPMYTANSIYIFYLFIQMFSYYSLINTETESILSKSVVEYCRAIDCSTNKVTGGSISNNNCYQVIECMQCKPALPIHSNKCLSIKTDADKYLIYSSSLQIQGKLNNTLNLDNEQDIEEDEDLDKEDHSFIQLETNNKLHSKIYNYTTENNTKNYSFLQSSSNNTSKNSNNIKHVYLPYLSTVNYRINNFGQEFHFGKNNCSIDTDGTIRVLLQIFIQSIIPERGAEASFIQLV